MTVPSVHCEARLHGVSKRRDKEGDWAQITIQVKPDEMPPALFTAPLGSRWMVAFAQIGDDETAVTQPEKPKAKQPAKQKRPFRELRRSAQAALACDWPEFQDWIDERDPDATSRPRIGAFVTANLLRDRLCITSRARLDTDEAAAARWDALFTQFEAETGRMPEVRS